MPKEYFKMSMRSKREEQSRRVTLSLLLLAVLQFATPTLALDHSVLTYKNASIQGQLVTSSTLVWESYNPKDLKQLQYAVEAGKYITEDEHYPMYVCRVTIDGLSTSGHTEKIMQAHVCVASNVKQTKYEKFEVLVNKGHFGKVAWKPWQRLYSYYIGAVNIGEDAFIARHRIMHADNETQHAAHWGAEYHFGIYDAVGFGKIKVIEDHKDKDYYDGEILQETEPFRYEMRDIRLDAIRLDMRDNLTELGEYFYTFLIENILVSAIRVTPKNIIFAFVLPLELQWRRNEKSNCVCLLLKFRAFHIERKRKLPMYQNGTSDLHQTWYFGLFQTVLIYSNFKNKLITIKLVYSYCFNTRFTKKFAYLFIPEPVNLTGSEKSYYFILKFLIL